MFSSLQSLDYSDCKLYLVQHGQGETKVYYSDRPLSEVGYATTEHVAAWAAKSGLQVNEIWHSGKLRAKQTADIFAGKLCPAKGTVEHDGMNPTDDVISFAEKLNDTSDAIMIVGHLPFLARLVALLICDDPEQTVVRFSNSGIVGLDREDNRWMISCVIPAGAAT